MTRVLVTGGAGFIGTTLVDALCRRHNEVVVVDDLSTSRRPAARDGVTFVESDINDLDQLSRAATDCDALIHMAARRSVPFSIENPLLTNHANVSGTLAVLEVARRIAVPRVVITSSSSVYGAGGSAENNQHPLSPYAVSKQAGDSYAAVYRRMLDLDVRIWLSADLRYRLLAHA